MKARSSFLRELQVMPGVVGMEMSSTVDFVWKILNSGWNLRLRRVVIRFLANCFLLFWMTVTNCSGKDNLCLIVS